MKSKTVVAKTLESSILLCRSKDQGKEQLDAQQLVPLRAELEKQIDIFSSEADGEIKVTIKTEYISSKKESTI